MKIKNFILLGLLPISVFAFKPSVNHPIAWSDVKINHLTITADALKAVMVKGETTTLTFSAEAMEMVKKANAHVDEAEADIHAAHCDAETIGGKGGCSERIINFKKDIIEILTQPKTTPNVTLARQKLGAAFHTLQDFYAHSNWLNLGRRYTYDALTDSNKYVEADTNERMPDKPDYKTCEWTWGLLPGTLIPDWRPTPKLKLEKRGNNVVTTGWFAGILGSADPEHYKCDHGIADGHGLNKDKATQLLHKEASELAITHSYKLVTDIINSVLSDSVLTNKEKFYNIEKFLGSRESSANLGFIVDTTVSMGSTITGIKSAMRQTVNKLKDEGKDIENFYLISYGDPHIGSVLTATDVDTMLSNINTVALGVPDYGGDYPELALDGLLRVVATASENTELYLYTDAPTKNHGLTDTIIKQAKDKNIKINFFLSDGGDASYGTIATATGGKTISYAHSVSGAEGTFTYINPSFDGNREELLKIVGVIPGAKGKSLKSAGAKTSTCTDSQDCGEFVYAIDPSISTKSGVSSSKLRKVIASNTVEHDINVDNSSEKILINIEMNPIGDIRLFRPDGTEAVVGDSDITIVKTSVSESITITTPTVGTWKIQIKGNAGQGYSLDVDTASDIRIIDFTFAEVKGRAGHEGLFPVNGQPLNTTEQYITLVVAGDIKTVALQVLALDGTKLSDVTLTETSKNEISAEYFAKLVLPSQPFRIAVVGEDISGASFERVYNQVYVGQSISVKPVTKKPILLQANKLSELVFTVTNTGVSDTFTLSATKEDGSVITLDETEITLDTNESKQINVHFTTPSNIGLKNTYNVTLSAQSKTNSDSKNYAVYKAEVNDEDLDNDGVSDKMEQFIYDGNKDGQDDYNQSNVISILSESGIGFTFKLKDSNFTNMSITEVPDTIKSSITGDMPFGLFDFTTLSTTEMKIIYKGNIYPTDYYVYNSASNSYTKDTTAIFEKGYAIIQTTSTAQKGFLVFNNTRPTAFVKKQSIFKNESITLDLLENSNDADGDTIRVYYIDDKSYKNGTIIKAKTTNKVVYTSPKDFNGTDYFQYRITDDKGGYYSIDVEIEIKNKAISQNKVTLSGNILNDGDGDTNVNGTPISKIDTKQLYVTLLDDSNQIVATKIVAPNGKYSFADVIENKNYSIVLTTVSNGTAPKLAVNWNNTGENINSLGKGKDTRIDGIINVPVGRKNITKIDFGINKAPHTLNSNMSNVTNKAGNYRLPVKLSFSDREDVKPNTIIFTKLPINGTLYYNNKVIIPFQSIRNFDEKLLRVDPYDGNRKLTFNYRVLDRAKITSNESKFTMQLKGNICRPATTICTIPPHPTSNLTSDSVVLHWRDTSINEFGYKIYKDSILIAIVGKNIRSYVLKNLESSTVHTYSIVSYDGHDEGIKQIIKFKTKGGYGWLVPIYNSILE